MKKLLGAFLIITLLLISCEKDETPYSNQNIGNYSLKSLESNIPLDLNYDNIETIDFKDELKFYFEQPIIKDNILELVQSINLDNELYLRINIPKDNYDPNQTFLDLRYGHSDYSKSIIIDKVTNKTKKINLIFSDYPLHDEHWLLQNNYPIPKEIVFIDIDTVIINLKQKFYNTKTEKWMLINLVATFNRIQE